MLPFYLVEYNSDENKFDILVVAKEAEEKKTGFTPFAIQNSTRSVRDGMFSSVVFERDLSAKYFFLPISCLTNLSLNISIGPQKPHSLRIFLLGVTFSQGQSLLLSLVLFEHFLSY